MQAIQKFQIGRLYYPNEKIRQLKILERDGKKLTVAHRRGNDEITFDVTVSLTADEKGAYEYFIYDNERIPATNLLPIGRSVSELPPEEQKIIMAAVMRDVERRKHQNPATAHETINEYDIVDNEIIDK